MAGTVRTYDPALNVITFAGQILAGLAPDTYIEIEYDADRFSDEVGAGGEVVRALMHDRRATVKFSTLATSQTNDILSSLLNADSQSGQGVAAFSHQELNGTTLSRAESAWIKKMPKMERKKEVSSVDWEIRCANLIEFVGGLS